jgi:hypothetical protein
MFEAHHIGLVTIFFFFEQAKWITTLMEEREEFLISSTLAVC